MSLTASLRNRIRRLEARATALPPGVVGVLLRPGLSESEALQRVEAAASTASTVYVANLARLCLRKD